MAAQSDQSDFAESRERRPVVAHERDQAGDQRDQAADGRDRAGNERDREATQRDLVADRRDHDGNQRDEAGNKRDQAADRRDQAVTDPLPSLSPDSETTVQTPLALDRRAAAGDRMRASQDRLAGARERLQAGHDRSTALTDRGQGASERAQAGLDRSTARADREASAVDRQEASVDGLTHVYLRTAGLVELERDMARARRTGQPLTVVFVDVDRLKSINDASGHAAGDRMLVKVANALCSHLRPYDLVIRYGGDEFICALLGLNPSKANERLTLVHASLAEGPEPGTVSVGLAELETGDSLADLIERADAALYHQRRVSKPPLE